MDIIDRAKCIMSTHRLMRSPGRMLVLSYGNNTKKSQKVNTAD